MALASLKDEPKTQSFGGEVAASRVRARERVERRLSPALAQLLQYVFSDREGDSGLKAINYGGADIIRVDGAAAKRWDAGDEDEDEKTFVHMFAAERYVQRSDPRASKSRRRAETALRAIWSDSEGTQAVAVLWAYYGPRTPGARTDLFPRDLAPVVVHTDQVEACRVAMVERLAEQSVAKASTTANALGSGGNEPELVAAAREAAARLERATAAIAAGESADARLRARLDGCDLTVIADYGPRPRDLLHRQLTRDIAHRAELAAQRAVSLERHRSRSGRAEEALAALRAALRTQGPRRDAPAPRDAASEAIRAGANRAITSSDALAALLGSEHRRRSKRSPVVSELRVAAHKLLTAAEDRFRDAYYAAEVG